MQPGRARKALGTVGTRRRLRGPQAEGPQEVTVKISGSQVTMQLPFRAPRDSGSYPQGSISVPIGHGRDQGNIK